MKTKIETIYKAIETWEHDGADGYRPAGMSLGFFKERAEADRLSKARSRDSLASYGLSSVQERQRLIFPNGRSFLLAFTDESWEGHPFAQPITVHQQYPADEKGVFATEYKGRFLLWEGREQIIQCVDESTAPWNGKGKFPRSRYWPERPANLALLPVGFLRNRLFILMHELFEVDFRLNYDDPSKTVHGWVEERDVSKELIVLGRHSGGLRISFA